MLFCILSGRGNALPALRGPTRSKRLRGPEGPLGLASRMARGPEGRSVRRLLFGFCPDGEGERPEAVRF
jgi:hypothetical protein